MPASYIPEGYRPIESSDIGKTFGVDLSPNFYIDNSKSPSSWSGSQITINFGGKATHPAGTYGTGVYRGYTSFQKWYYASLVSGPTIWDNNKLWSCTSLDFSLPFTLTEITGPISRDFNRDSNMIYFDFIYVRDITEKEKFILSTNSLAKSITDKAGTTGKKSITELKVLVDNLKTTFTGQEKTVTPSKTSQVITPDTSYDGLSKVTVNPIPTDYIIPSGTLEVTENGTKDVTNYKSVNVNVPTPELIYWDGSYTLSGLASGYTLTLEVASGNYIDTDFEYSTDNGTTWNKFTVGTTTLENINTITFKAISVAYGLCVGTTSGGNDILSMLVSSNDPYEVPITENTVLYVSSIRGSGGAD